MDVQAGRTRLSKGVKLAGLVGGKRMMTTSRGSKMAFVQMSDATGAYEVTLFQETLSQARELLDAGSPLLITVDVQKRGEGEDADLRLTATQVRSLEEEAAQAVDGMCIYLRDDAAIKPLQSVIEGHGRPGRGIVKFRLLDRPEGDIDIELTRKYAVTGGFRQAVKSIPGIVDVKDV